MKLYALAAVVSSWLLAASDARADGSVTIDLTPEGDQLASDLGLDPAELEQQIRDRLAEYYDTANVDGFLRTFANATPFASRGTGVDYAPLFHTGIARDNLFLSVHHCDDDAVQLEPLRT